MNYDHLSKQQLEHYLDVKAQSNLPGRAKEIYVTLSKLPKTQEILNELFDVILMQDELLRRYQRELAELSPEPEQTFFPMSKSVHKRR